MRAQDIVIGDTLRLKAERAEAYGMQDSPLVTVTSIHVQARYKTPWIYARTAAFKPSDFERIEQPRQTLNGGESDRS